MKLSEILKTSEGRILFMSDLHYGHDNVIRFDKRPFKGVDEMNTFLEKELVEKIRPEDTLIDLGDLFWKCTEQEMMDVLGKIPAKRKIKVMGNHDKWPTYQSGKLGKYFNLVCDQLDIRVEHLGTRYEISLCHYPMVSWNKKPGGAWMVHGHNHGNIDDYNHRSPDLRVDVSYGGTLAKEVGSFLVSFEDLLRHFTKKSGGTSFNEYTLKNCKEL